MQFQQGLSKIEDWYAVIKDKQRNLQECYTSVSTIRSAKTMAVALDKGPREASPGRKFGKKKEKKQRELWRLEGAVRQKAWKEGRCLNCGKLGHMWAECPEETEKSLKTFTKQVFTTYGKGFKGSAGDQKKRRKTRLNRLESQIEEEEEDGVEAGKGPDQEGASGSDSDSSESQDETSENSDPKFEG